jgi:hypothetical protein
MKRILAAAAVTGSVLAFGATASAAPDKEIITFDCDGEELTLSVNSRVGWDEDGNKYKAAVIVVTDPAGNPVFAKSFGGSRDDAFTCTADEGDGFTLTAVIVPA